ncbi:MAG: hypothetical protein NC215_00315 [Ruminococcus sp.]|nr:hypothetical protein [Ruminococcus sp.]
MKVTVTEIIEKDGEVKFVSHEEEQDFSATEGRHDPLCVVCGMEPYPECRKWCPNCGYEADEK